MLIPFDTQPRGTPVLIPYEGLNGERYEYHAVQDGGDEFYRCPAGDPVGVVQVDGVWHWEVEPATGGTERLQPGGTTAEGFRPA